MAVVVPDQVVAGELIESAWGNSVRSAIQALKSEKADWAGGTFTAGVYFGGNPTTTAGSIVTATGSIYTTYSAGDSIPNLRLRRAYSAAAVTAGQHYIRFLKGEPSSTVGSISISSGGVSYNTTSDPRLKTRTADITDAAERVQQLGHAVYRGVWNDDETSTMWDLINAPDIAAVAPYAVTGEPDAVYEDGSIAPMMVDQAALIPLLCAALGDALDRIAALEGNTP